MDETENKSQMVNLNRCECGKVLWAKGMCRKCYSHTEHLRRNPNAKRIGKRNGNATCHLDRPMYNSNGLCQSCYNKQYHYGADFVAMYKEQDGLCKCCGIKVEESLMHIDHNHKTMMVRGLLCLTCNLLVGWIEHPNLDLAITYLKTNND